MMSPPPQGVKTPSKGVKTPSEGVNIPSVGVKIPSEGVMCHKEQLSNWKFVSILLHPWDIIHLLNTFKLRSNEYLLSH